MSVFQGRKKQLIGLVLWFTAQCVNADTLQDWASANFKSVELSAAVGMNRYIRHNAHLIISPFETDKANVRRTFWGSGMSL